MDSLNSRFHRTTYMVTSTLVLSYAAGHPRMIDLDVFVSGPREWDLIQTAMYYDSLGWPTEAEYADFVAGYGFDVRKWAGYAVLRRVRERRRQSSRRIGI
jgi:hypothetical protein